MKRRFLMLFAWVAFAAIASLPAAAQEYSNGGVCATGRGDATLTPVEAYGVHPPGLDPADTRRLCYRLRQPFFPYYAPVSPVASTARWKPWGYYPLLPYYTPYYLGYCPHRLFNPPPQPYGADGWGKGPMPDHPLPKKPGTTPLEFGPYTSVIDDDTTFWNMGGNGLVPYGAPGASRVGPPDLIDAIQGSRAGGVAHASLRHAEPTLAPTINAPHEVIEGPPRIERREPNAQPQRRLAPAEPIPPGEISRPSR